ncbi:MAG: hypothetical protein SH859_14625 [Hyphomicrobium aestuarii]|mgnify:CR=1 FL=1|nr:hypothetical protein [Hyphomicrobium aestuarii]
MGKGYDLPLHVAEAVKREARGEPVLWVEQPDAVLAFRNMSIVCLFGIPWTVFVVLWEFIAVAPFLPVWLVPAGLAAKNHTGSILMVLWGLPFLAVGAVLMALPPLAMVSARQEAYAVTPTQLLTVRAYPNGRSTVIRTPLLAIAGLVATDRGRGFGTLKIIRGESIDSDGGRTEDADTWDGIPDVRRAEDVILAAQSAAGRIE